jgi:hypothetical protein
MTTEENIGWPHNGGLQPSAVAPRVRGSTAASASRARRG